MRRSLLQIRYQPRENLFRQRENDVAQFLGVKGFTFGRKSSWRAVSSANALRALGFV